MRSARNPVYKTLVPQTVQQEETEGTEDFIRLIFVASVTSCEIQLSLRRNSRRTKVR